MQVTEYKTPLKKSGLESESKFGIKASKEAFRILSSGLYSNKVRAIIRELSCNAWDSHVDAGNKNQTFDVHLPTQFEPTFYVRDYGTGMSKEFLEENYNNYFDSDKQQSNDFTGCFGLGSKSPFAYTDQWTVTSYYNGRAYHYVCYVDEEGYPVTALMSEDDTDESNGLKVSFAVKREDFNSFYHEVAITFSYFAKEAKPNIINDENYRPIEYTTSLEGNGWRFVNNQNKALALMGNIAYPIDVSRLNDETAKSLAKTNILIDFEIGTLQVTASREHLEYTKRTVKNLEGRLLAIYEEIRQKVSRELNACQSLWEARKKSEELKKSLPRKLKSIVAFEWNGIKFDNNYYFTHAVHHYYIRDVFGRAGNRIVCSHELKSREQFFDRLSLPCGHEGNYNEEYLFIVNNTNINVTSRLRDHLKENYKTNNQPKVFVFNAKGKDPEYDEAALKKELECIGLDKSHKELVRATDILDFSKKPRQYQSQRKLGDVYNFIALSRYQSYSTGWTEAKQDIDDLEGLWIEVKNRKPVFELSNGYKDLDYPLTYLASLFRNYQNLTGDKTSSLYGIKTKDLDKAKGNLKLKHIDAALKEAVDNYDKSLLSLSRQDLNEAELFVRLFEFVYQNKLNNELFKELEKTKEFFEKFKNTENKNQIVRRILKNEHRISFTVKSQIDEYYTEKYKSLKEKYLEKYPLYKKIVEDRYTTIQEEKHLIQYIKMVDNGTIK